MIRKPTMDVKSAAGVRAGREARLKPCFAFSGAPDASAGCALRAQSTSQARSTPLRAACGLRPTEHLRLYLRLSPISSVQNAIFSKPTKSGRPFGRPDAFSVSNSSKSGKLTPDHFRLSRPKKLRSSSADSPPKSPNSIFGL